MLFALLWRVGRFEPYGAVLYDWRGITRFWSFSFSWLELDRIHNKRWFSLRFIDKVCNLTIIKLNLKAYTQRPSFQSIIGGMFPLPRILYAIACDGLIFKSLAYIYPKTKTPFISTLLSGSLIGIYNFQYFQYLLQIKKLKYFPKLLFHCFLNSIIWLT